MAAISLLDRYKHGFSIELKHAQYPWLNQYGTGGCSVLLYLTLFAIAVGVASAALICKFKGAPAFRAQATSDFEATKVMMASCLEQDLCILDAQLSAINGSRGSLHLNQAWTYHSAAVRFAGQVRTAEGGSVWQLIVSCTESIANAAAELAAARAETAGRSLPAKTPPCLFDPTHGPSTTHVEWAPPNSLPRAVPVCGTDAKRIATGAPPLVRMVQSFEGVVPYYACYGLYTHWLLGFFSGFDPFLTARLLSGTPIGAHLPGAAASVRRAPIPPELCAEFRLSD
ncbi:hypothetical protein ACF08N_36145 [Streptomyces sp. NPDC015127]|uniref:hypothetical protein n=1 Tax=Streptomyces sp. NPDC015127 TaxID=3364939 RepID=UPI0036FC7476